MRRGRFLVRRQTSRLTLLFVFLLAFAIRAYWTLRVQHPLNAVFSDMGGYVLRAELLLAGKLPGEPRMLTLWPWGTHAIVATEFLVLGRQSFLAIGLCHAAIGAIAAPCASALTARFVRGRLAPLVSGVVVACWHPHVVFSGFFSSEIWFTSAALLATVLLVRRAEGRGNLLVVGLFLAIAFIVRPQIILTLPLIAIGLLYARLRGRPLLRFRPGGLEVLLFPLAVAIGASSVRLYLLTGRVGLIASYEPAQRLFGATEVSKLEATWTAPNGERWSWWFNPPTKGVPTETTTERYEGFIADPDIIHQIQKRRLANVGIGARVQRMIDNVALLALGNVPWPESDFKVTFRRVLQKGFARGFFVVFGFALIGLARVRRHSLAGLLVGAQLATVIVVAALYIGEARYRVPYDPLLIVLAVLGLWTVVAFLAKRFRRSRARAPA